ncbi:MULTISPECIES: tyrosine-type DNA invertase [Photorhabdus]|uniref:Tyrosine-type DNA invertase n=2 Tax=Photorhabdus TaxID=29487 RepID=A0AAW6BQL5_9GAMM|nr:MULTISPECIES: tyrosine-type DNA invertase [Photorhabdus]EYU13630.1 site-specific recombinase XerD [Photorhabdus aegyptia]MDB6373974.1 tyrosine-type DNA invertase [Photorhabdus bodei]
MGQRKHLTQSEVEKMLEMAKKGANPERDYCFVYMSFIHGLRVSEARHLRLSDLNLEDGSLYIQRLKGGLCTNQPLLGYEIQAIKEWLKVRKTFPGAESNWLFLSRSGKPLARQRIYQIIKQLGELANISVPAHPHMLRHACGFSLADRGTDTRLIQDYLGHCNIRHTVRYTASNSERFRGIWRNTRNRAPVLHFGLDDVAT